MTQKIKDHSSDTIILLPQTMESLFVEDNKRMDHGFVKKIKNISKIVLRLEATVITEVRQVNPHITKNKSSSTYQAIANMGSPILSIFNRCLACCSCSL